MQADESHSNSCSLHTVLLLLETSGLNVRSMRGSGTNQISATHTYNASEIH